MRNSGSAAWGILRIFTLNRSFLLILRRIDRNRAAMPYSSFRKT